MIHKPTVVSKPSYHVAIQYGVDLMYKPAIMSRDYRLVVYFQARYEDCEFFELLCEICKKNVPRSQVSKQV